MPIGLVEIGDNASTAHENSLPSGLDLNLPALPADAAAIVAQDKPEPHGAGGIGCGEASADVGSGVVAGAAAGGIGQ